MFHEVKEKDIEEIKEMLSRETRQSLISFGDTLRFPGIVDYATKDELINHIAYTEMKDRRYDLYETFIYELYLFKMEKIFQDLLAEVDQSQLAIWNYEDGVSSYLAFRDAKYFEEYVKGDLIIIRDTVFGDHEDFSFKGNIQDFSEDVQLFLKLQ